MPRAPADIAHTDETAAAFGYKAPPPDLEPQGQIGIDRAWDQLARWFKDQGMPWDTAVLVYISRRFDTPIGTAYLETDNWAKRMNAAFALEVDPDANVSFN